MPTTPVSIAPKALSSIFSSAFFSRSSPSPSPAPTAPTPEPPSDPLAISTLEREIHIYQADIKVNVSSTYAKELERATKKPAPSRMPASLIFTRQDELVHQVEGSSSRPAQSGEGIFAGLVPPVDGDQSAKVFIGQATAQTTGIGGHLSARFIPTVERESMDLVDKHVSHWNKELLWVGGYLSRLIFDNEMTLLQTEWQQTATGDTSRRAESLSRGLHILRFFSFKPSTPSAVVAQEMESAFYSCARDNKQLLFVANGCILPINQIRTPNSTLTSFLPDLPVIPQDVLNAVPRTVARLRERSLLHEVTLEDVIKQLNVRPLGEAEMIACLKWWESISSMEGYSSSARNRFLGSAILVQADGKVVPLDVIGTVVKPQSSSIPPDMPLPLHTLPYAITKDLKANTIYNVFGWTELTLQQYVTYIIQPPMSGDEHADSETDMRVSPSFAERVLSMLGRAWQSISANQQSSIALELRDVACIPTKAGFKKPSEAYFEKNLLFDDLPTLALPKTPTIKGGLEKMLLAIGVRRTVDLQLVFTRLIGGGSWSCQDLMKYLVSVKDTLSDEEVNRLRHTAAFPLESTVKSDSSKRSTIRKKPLELYEPTEAMRALALPVLDWEGVAKWRSNSDEGGFQAEMRFNMNSSENAFQIGSAEIPTCRCASGNCFRAISNRSSRVTIPLVQPQYSLCRLRTVQIRLIRLCARSHASWITS